MTANLQALGELAIVTAYPTGTCFDDATAIAGQLLQKVKHKKKVFICHGIARYNNEDDDRPFAHAWVEFGGEVYQRNIVRGKIVNVVIKRKTFYAQLGIIERRRYSLERLERIVKRRPSLTSGPWYRPYWLLCRDNMS